jgi:hypothetical protein
MNLSRFTCGAICASLLAACSAHQSTSLIPIATPSQSNANSFHATISSSTIQSTAVALDGPIAAIFSGGFTIESGPSYGYVHVDPISSEIVSADTGSISVGNYALAVGTMSSDDASLSAQYVAGFTSKPTSTQVTGTYLAAKGYGIQIEGPNGYLPILVSSSTSISGNPAVGEPVTVTGIGSVNSAILAGSISAGAVPTPSAPTHVLTADYYGPPYGPTTLTPSQLAPYLTWASSLITYSNELADAGIKTMVYTDANRIVPDSPLWSSPSNAFAHTCSGDLITDYFDNTTFTLMNNGSTALQSAYDSYISSWTSGNSVNAIFEDDVVVPSYYPAGFFSPGLPCDYSDSSWLANERSLEASINHDTIINGLSALNDEGPSLSVQVLSNPSTIGGMFENCVYESTDPDGVWVWTALENTQLEVTAERKIFQCMDTDGTQADDAYAGRIYTLASFLMTYNPAYSVLWELYGTPSGFHVMPESQLVPLDPVVPTPSTVSNLESNDVYFREYRECYYAGRLIGQCAMVVNNDRAVHATPALTLSYHHTLVLSGNGVLDGGTVSFEGPAPPSSLGAESAFIAVP